MEAIVILILAVVMLGLGLTFVRTMFSNITDKAKNAIDVADLSAKPSEGEPVVFSPNNPEIKEGKQINVQVGFYNPSTSADNWMMKVIDSSYDDGVCGGMSNPDVFCGDSGTALQTIYNDKPFKLSKDEQTGWNIIFDSTPGLEDQTYTTKPILLTVQFCSVEDIEDDDCEDDAEVYQKELFLTVRK